MADDGLSVVTFPFSFRAGADITPATGFHHVARWTAGDMYYGRNENKDHDNYGCGKHAGTIAADFATRR